jgi:hypothetical protein
VGPSEAALWQREIPRGSLEISSILFLSTPNKLEPRILPVLLLMDLGYSWIGVSPFFLISGRDDVKGSWFGPSDKTNTNNAQPLGGLTPNSKQTNAL